MIYDTCTLLIYTLKGIYNGILKLLHCTLMVLYRQQEKKEIIWKIAYYIGWNPGNDIDVQHIIISIIFH